MRFLGSGVRVGLTQGIEGGESMNGWSFCGVLLIGSLGWAPSCPLWAEERPAIKPLVVFLVRHAEKVDASRDPELSAAGKKRAGELASALRNAGLNHIHSSDYIRTRDTAAPIAARLGLKTALYDARDLPALVEKLRRAGGRHLVVGHSTSTPAVVQLLGGRADEAIDEADEFDRLYIVTLDAQGEASTVLIRYGAPFHQ